MTKWEFMAMQNQIANEKMEASGDPHYNMDYPLPTDPDVIMTEAGVEDHRKGWRGDEDIRPLGSEYGGQGYNDERDKAWVRQKRPAEIGPYKEYDPIYDDGVWYKGGEGPGGFAGDPDGRRVEVGPNTVNYGQEDSLSQWRDVQNFDAPGETPNPNPRPHIPGRPPFNDVEMSRSYASSINPIWDDKILDDIVGRPAYPKPPYR